MYILQKFFWRKTSFFTNRNEIEEKEKFLATRFQNALLIPGIQKLHKVISAGNGRVKIYETSNANEEEKITLNN